MLATINGMAQTERGPQCTNCTDPNDYITNNGDNTFTADSAQAYYWEICSGGFGISIYGSNTGQTVTIQGTPGSSFSIKVTRFVNGNCIEACESTTIQNLCEFEPDLFGKHWCNGPSGSSGYGYALFDMTSAELQDVSSVQWIYDINNNNYPGFEFSNGSQTFIDNNISNGVRADFTFDSNCQTILTFVFDLYITFNNGCTPNPLLIQDVAVTTSTFSPTPIVIFPNPTISNNVVEFEGIDFENISNIEIKSLQGVQEKTIKPNQQSFDVSGLKPGIYLLIFETNEGAFIRKKLIVQ